MNERPDGSENWEEMLRAIFGPEAAERIAEQLRAQGANMDQIGKMVDPTQMAMISSQIRQLLGSSGDGPVNWKVTEEFARDAILRQRLDSLSGQEGDDARTALRNASFWLDAATDLGPASGPAMALTRLDWIAHTLGTFRKLLGPVGENVSRAFVEALTGDNPGLPEQISAVIGNPKELSRKMIATVLGTQYGMALADLATNSFGSTDTGVPLLEGSSAVLVPSNIDNFADGLDVPRQEVMAYVAVREAAAARLYTQVPWLRTRVLDTIAEIASGIQIDMASIEDQIREMGGPFGPGFLPEEFDPANPPTIDMSDIFVLELSEDQLDSVARLELLLSLIEGWVSVVSAQAVAPHLPNAVPLREMFARRYATDNPAKHVWESQLGLELTPRRLRETVHFWELATAKLGMEQRDALWAHPDLLPTSDAIDDPDSFFTAQTTDISAELDSFLEELFNDEAGEGPHEPGFGNDSPDSGSSPDGDRDSEPGPDSE